MAQLEAFKHKDLRNAREALVKSNEEREKELTR